MRRPKSGGGAKSKYSPRPPSGHHATFAPRKERNQIFHVLAQDSESRRGPFYFGRLGCIRTQIGAFKYFMESISSLVSYGSGLTSISVAIRQESQFPYNDLFLYGYVMVDQDYGGRPK